MGTLTSPDRCVDKPSKGKTSMWCCERQEAAAEERENGTDGAKKVNKYKKKDSKNTLSSAFCSVWLSAQSYSLSNFPFIPPPKLAAVRPPRAAPLIDDLIWELTWHTLCQLFRLLHSRSALSSLLNTLSLSLLCRLLLPDRSQPRPSATQHVADRQRHLILLAK